MPVTQQIMPLRDVPAPPLERRASDLRLSAQVALTRALTESSSLTAATPKIIRTACETMSWDAGALWEPDSAGGGLVCLDFWAAPFLNLRSFETMSRRASVGKSDGLLGVVWGSGEPGWVSDVHFHKDGARNAAAARAGLRGHFCFPIRAGRRLSGVMEFFSVSPRQPDYGLLQMMSLIGSQVGQFIKQKRVEESLRESREKYRLLFSAVSDAIVIHDMDSGRVVDANDAALKTYGYARKDFLNLGVRDLTAGPSADGAPPEVPIQHRSRALIHRRRRRDGAVFSAEVTAGTFKWKDRLMGIRVERDITQRLRADEAERLRHSERMQREFVATVSHEFRTPVAAIRGFAETLLQGGLADERNRVGFVKTIEKHATRLSRLVESLLDLSAMEGGKRPPKLETIALADFTRTFAKSLNPLFKKKRLSLRVEIGGAMRASFDKIQLSQVLQNLLSNAIKFSRRGGRVHISARELRHAVIMTVRDSGIGIEPEYLPRIFERFNQARRDRSVGTGLGLSIVKQIVESHGGHVWAESERGRGTAFHFTLPRTN